jgi:hypothetical protein
MAMGTSNSTPKKRSLTYHLHKQWIQTKTGKELHAKEVKRQHSLPIKPKRVK